MPRKVSYRKQQSWTPIAPKTFGMNCGCGMLVLHATDHDTESMAFVPGASVDIVAPMTEREICVDGDPDCGDPECERKHAVSPDLRTMPDKPRERFCVTPPPGLSVGCVVRDAELGHEVLLPNTPTAETVLQMLRAAAGDVRAPSVPPRNVILGLLERAVAAGVLTHYTIDGRDGLATGGEEL